MALTKVTSNMLHQQVTGDIDSKFSLTDVTVTSTSKTLVVGEFCIVTAASQTITLPASPSAGDSVTISVGNFLDTIIARNGSNIMGAAEDVTIDVTNAGVTLAYSDASNGWRIFCSSG